MPTEVYDLKQATLKQGIIGLELFQGYSIICLGQFKPCFKTNYF